MSIFGTKTVDAIMSRFTKTIVELVAHAEAQDAEYIKHEAVELNALEAKLAAAAEATKARKMADRLSELFD